MYCIQNKGSHCSPWEGVEGVAPLPGDFRTIVCPTPPQMNDFCDLLGTPDAPVSKIASVNVMSQVRLGEFSVHKMKIVFMAF